MHLREAPCLGSKRSFVFCLSCCGSCREDRSDVRNGCRLGGDSGADYVNARVYNHVQYYVTTRATASRNEAPKLDPIFLFPANTPPKEQHPSDFSPHPFPSSPAAIFHQHPKLPQQLAVGTLSTFSLPYQYILPPSWQPSNTASTASRP